jgi:hypothetical protein
MPWQQFYWFRSVVKLYNSMLKLGSETLSRVLKADRTELIFT